MSSPPGERRNRGPEEVQPCSAAQLEAQLEGVRSKTHPQAFQLPAESFLPRPSCDRPAQGQRGPGDWEHRRSEGKGASLSPGNSPVRDTATHCSSHQDSRQVDGLGHGLQGLGVTHQVPLAGEEGS